MNRTRFSSALMAVILAVGILSMGIARPAAASEKTWRYVTYAGAAATALGIAKKKPLIAAVGAAGGYLGYRKWKGEAKERRERERRFGRRDR